MKRVSVICALLLALLLTACGGTGSSAGQDPIELGEAMTEAAQDLPAMSTVTSQDDDGAELFRYLSDLDYDKVDGYYFSYASAGTAEEIAVIRLKSADDADEAKASLECHREDRLGIFEFYSPDQVPMAEDGEIRSQGNMVVLAFCQNPTQVAGLLNSGT
jgi:predicted small secreted protein